MIERSRTLKIAFAVFQIFFLYGCMHDVSVNFDTMVCSFIIFFVEMTLIGVSPALIIHTRKLFVQDMTMSIVQVGKGRQRSNVCIGAFAASAHAQALW
jgi:hypothetical protein